MLLLAGTATPPDLGSAVRSRDISKHEHGALSHRRLDSPTAPAHCVQLLHRVAEDVVLGFQEDVIGIRLRDVIGVDNMMWGSDYPHSESTFPQSRKILAEILAGVPDDEQAKIVGGNTARVYNFDMTRLTVSVCRASLSAGRPDRGEGRTLPNTHNSRRADMPSGR